MDVLSFADIPLDLIPEILIFLDAKSLLSCSLVCRLWHDIVTSSPALQYAIELWADGLVPGDSGTLTPAETLAALHERRRAWKNMQWTTQNIVPIESLMTCHAYELAGGVFAQQTHGPDFMSVSLPSILQAPDKATATHTIAINPDHFEDFAIDPSQDLLAILHQPPTGDAHLECRTLSSCGPHPLAPIGLLSFALDRDPIIPRTLTIQIVDDIIAVFFPKPIQLVLFNWRAGLIITELRDVESPTASDFHFLTSRSYILTRNMDSGRIEIYSFAGDRSDVPTHVTTLQLPELAPDIIYVTIFVHSGPFCAKPMSGVPFSTSNEDRVYLLMLHYNYGEVFRLFVHHRTLQKYALAHLGGAPTVVPWEEWGPHGSRMLPGRDHRWLRHVHGERVALPCDNSTFVQILDFGINIHRPGSSVWFSTDLHLEADTIRDDGTFLNAVTTSLPYRSTMCPLGESYNLVLIDQDRIIGVNNSVPGRMNQMTVYTF
ncbi:hypothetical protein C8R44DRAFT_778953 [Mycena epipterygia]|nr:hypothetical protein C8R44DRAFT_778953 [Mycena epipterygia]